MRNLITRHSQTCRYLHPLQQQQQQTQNTKQHHYHVGMNKFPECYCSKVFVKCLDPILMDHSVHHPWVREEIMACYYFSDF